MKISTDGFLWKRSLSGKVTDTAKRTALPFFDVIDQRIGRSRKIGCVLFRKFILGFIYTRYADVFEFQVFWKIAHQVKEQPPS